MEVFVGVSTNLEVWGGPQRRNRVHLYPFNTSERLRKTLAHFVASEGIQLRICRPTSMKYADY